MRVQANPYSLDQFPTQLYLTKYALPFRTRQVFVNKSHLLTAQAEFAASSKFHP